MPSRIDEAGHTKAFDYPVAEHWGLGGKSKNETVPGGIRTHKMKSLNSMPGKYPIQTECDYIIMGDMGSMVSGERQPILNRSAIGCWTWTTS